MAVQGPGRSLWSFALAKSFREQGTDQVYNYQPNRLERVGRALRWGVGSVLDLLIREIKNPITIVALTALAMLAATIIFYPASVLSMAATVCPFVLKIQPWMLKFALFILAESTVLGIGVRAYGRFQNQELLERWRRGELDPAFIGDRQRRPGE